jgi:hypothetical protein
MGTVKTKPPNVIRFSRFRFVADVALAFPCVGETAMNLDTVVAVGIALL